jgi:glutamate--cysteine ligase
MTVEVTADDRVLRDVGEARSYVAGVCFKTGPPTLTGVELEWTVHHTDDPQRPLHREIVAHALHPHSPPTLDPLGPALPLPGGNRLTVEPGGQVEISALPQPSLTALRRSVDRDIGHLTDLLARAGLRLGEGAIDPHRSGQRILHTPRYDAMAEALARHNRHGPIMMCDTAGLQVCLDAGRPADLADRWAAVHEFGPALVALFANSRRHAGHDTGWASARMRTWLRMDPARTGPIATDADPVAAWVAYALRAPVLCVRRPTGPWQVPIGVTFADWINGALDPGPTRDDLEYHLSTLFPPVRPRGYFEVRYLDTQPNGEWLAPAAMLSALMSPDMIDSARCVSAPVAGRWLEAARLGLDDARLATAARGLAELALDRLDGLGLPAPDRDHVHQVVDRRLAGEMERIR